MEETSPIRPARPEKKRKLKPGVASIVTLLFVGTSAWFFFIGPKLRHDRLMKNGVQASGRLILVDETGHWVNKSPELELTVEFTRKDGVLDTAVTEFVPNRRSLQFFHEGRAVTIAYDPEDSEEITIAGVGGDSPTVPAVPASDLRSVDSLQRVTDSLARQMQEMKSKLEEEAKKK